MCKKVDYKKHLENTTIVSRDYVEKVKKAFKEPWAENPNTDVRAVFGMWVMMACRHLEAVQILANSGDTAMVSKVHIRQLLEILFQARYLSMADEKSREDLAKKVIAWGGVDYLEKLEVIMDLDSVKNSHEVISDSLNKFDDKLISEIRNERAQRKYYWFGMSVNQLAKRVSRDEEDFQSVYHIISAQIHGSWDVILGVTSPKPGFLVFQEYNGMNTLYRWASEDIDDATKYFLQIWNEIAEITGAPHVLLK